MFKIGDKAKGFKFESDTGSVFYENKMDDYVGELGEVVEVYSDSFVIMFSDQLEWMYPSSLWHLAKVEDTKHFKVGDRVKFKKSSLATGMIDSDESCSYKVIAVDTDYQWVKIYQNGWPIMYHPNHFEHVKEETMENTEEQEIKWEGSQIDWQVGQEVFCLLRGKGVVSYIAEGDDIVHAIGVRFKDSEDCYTRCGKLDNSHKNRSLFFSEPEIIAEKFPPKKPFIPTLKKGDIVFIKVSGELFGEGTVRTVYGEHDDRIYISEDGMYFMKKDIVSLHKLGEEIKFN